MQVPKIFGREPVVITNFVEGILALALAFHLLDFIGVDTAEEMAVIMAVVTTAMGVYIAYVTRDTLLGAVQGLIKAVIVLFAAFGYDLDAQQTAAILGITVLGAALWHRTQTGPAVLAGFNLSSHSVDVPPEGQALDTVPAVTPTGVLVEKPVPPQNPPTAQGGGEL